MTVKITIDNKTVFRILAVIFVFLFAITFVSATRHALTLLLISAFIAMALNPPVSYLSSKITGGSRGAATGIAYLVVVSIISTFLWAMVPPLVSQTREFATDLPNQVDKASQGDGAVATFIRDYNIDKEIEDYIDEFRSGSTIGNTSSQVFAGINRVGAALVSLLTVLVLTFFMLVEGPDWLDRYWSLQPKSKREHRKSLAKRMYNVITGYVNGQLLIALLAASTSLIVMLLVGLPLPLPLAGMVGLFGLIPLVGATLGSVVVIVVALFQSVQTAVILFAFFILYQQFENNFIQPYVQSRTLDVSPLLVLTSVIFGVSIGGILGGFIAIPLAACIRILTVDYLEHHKKMSEEEDSVLKKVANKVLQKST